MKRLRVNWGNVAHLVPDEGGRTRPALCGYFPGRHLTERAGQAHMVRWRSAGSAYIARDCDGCKRGREGT